MCVLPFSFGVVEDMHRSEAVTPSAICPISHSGTPLRFLNFAAPSFCPRPSSMISQMVTRKLLAPRRQSSMYVPSCLSKLSIGCGAYRRTDLFASPRSRGNRFHSQSASTSHFDYATRLGSSVKDKLSLQSLWSKSEKSDDIGLLDSEEVRAWAVKMAKQL